MLVSGSILEHAHSRAAGVHLPVTLHLKPSPNLCTRPPQDAEQTKQAGESLKSTVPTQSTGARFDYYGSFRLDFHCLYTRRHPSIPPHIVPALLPHAPDNYCSVGRGTRRLKAAPSLLHVSDMAGEWGRGCAQEGLSHHIYPLSLHLGSTSSKSIETAWLWV